MSTNLGIVLRYILSWNTRIEPELKTPKMASVTAVPLKYLAKPS